MKILFWALPALIVSSTIGAAASAATTHANASAAATTHANAGTASTKTPLQTTWAQVKDDTSYLDDLIARKQLAQVHEAAYNLRDSIRDLRHIPPQSPEQLTRLTNQLGALAENLDRSGDKNDLRATVGLQRQLHLLLDEIAALYPAELPGGFGPVVTSSAVKDPVCRMTVDPATAPGKVPYAGQTYYFCSVGDAAAFKTSPAKYAALFDDLTFGRPKSFTIALAASPKPQAGKTTLLSFAVHEKGQQSTTKDFQKVHEKLMHLIVVSQDLNYFAHLHPTLTNSGKFLLRWTVPAPGKYSLFADFTPANGLNQILRSPLTVSGPVKAGVRPLKADTNLTRSVGSLDISLRISAPLRAGQESLLTYTLRSGHQPVTTMQPYLGAMGHLMAINQNGVDAVHTHTVSAGGPVTRDMATAKGPSFTYELTPKTPGLTKIWAQFQHAGQVITVPFTFAVLPPLAKP